MKSASGILTLLLLALVPVPAESRAQEWPRTTTVETATTIDASGNATVAASASFPDAREYRLAVDDYSGATTRRDTLYHARTVLHDRTASFDAAGNRIAVKSEMAGAAVLRRGRWEVNLDAPYRLIHAGGRTALFVNNTFSDADSLVTEIARFTLPEGATDIAHDRSKRVLSYRLPRTARPDGLSRLECGLETRPNIITSLPKIHSQPDLLQGSLWVARTLLRNTGDSDITDIGIRYRIEGYTSWSSDSRYDLLPPGGTLVDCYHPLFNAPAPRPDSPGPVEVEMRIYYRDGAGNRHEESRAGKATLLDTAHLEVGLLPRAATATWRDGFMNAGLLAGYVTPADPTIRELAAEILRAKNIAAIMTEDDAARFCRAVHEYMRTASILCLDPPAFLTQQAPPTPKVQFPRDTLRYKSGTSLDLTLLFCSLCEAAGLETGIGLAPGACLALVRPPEGETLPFSLASLRAGAGRTPDAAYAEGKRLCGEEAGMAVVDVGSMQRLGVTPPEFGGTEQ